MQEIIARCGNRCDLCPLYQDNFSQADAPEINNLVYRCHNAGKGPKPRYTPGCEGCLGDGYVAREGCEIRNCVNTHQFSTCADCERLFCDLLEADLAVVEGALRDRRMDMSQIDYQKYFRPFLIREKLTALRKRTWEGSVRTREPSTEHTAGGVRGAQERTGLLFDIR